MICNDQQLNNDKNYGWMVEPTDDGLYTFNLVRDKSGSHSKSPKNGKK